MTSAKLRIAVHSGRNGRTDADMEWVNDSGSSAGSSAIGRASTLLSGEVRAWVAGRTGI